MWTTENRAQYSRDGLRYPSDLTDAEWAEIKPLIPPARRGGNKRTVDIREVTNGLMFILGTGCQRRAIPRDLPHWRTIYDYMEIMSGFKPGDQLEVVVMRDGKEVKLDVKLEARRPE